MISEDVQQEIFMANPFGLVAGVPGRFGAVVKDAVALARRVDATVQNLGEYLRFGGLRVDEESSPFEIVSRAPMFKLRRYFPDDVPGDLPALVLVPPLMIAAEVYDVAPRTSSVRAVHECGIDVWVVDFGRPEQNRADSRGPWATTRSP